MREWGEVVAEMSGWAQMGMMLGMLYYARRIADQFKLLPSWRLVWMLFAIGFGGMLGSRILVLLLAYGWETATVRWTHRYLTPFMASTGLFAGMALLYRLLARIQAMNRSIHLPHPAGFELDREGRVLAWDTGAESLYGWTAAEALGARLVDLITPMHIRPTHVSIVTRYLQEGEPPHLSHRYTISTRYRDTEQEFASEVILTGQPGEGDTLTLKAVARALVPL